MRGWWRSRSIPLPEHRITGVRDIREERRGRHGSPRDHHTSQLYSHGLGKDALREKRTQSAGGHDIDASAEYFLEFVSKVHLIEKRGLRIEIDQKVDIAIVRLFLAGARAKDIELVDLVPVGNPVEVVAPRTDGVKHAHGFNEWHYSKFFRICG